VRGGPTAGLMGGTGGKESLNDLGLVPQSVLMVKWEDESMNGESLSMLCVRSGEEEEAE
jgi:tether containing UBX domain for GLUT4